MAIIFLGLGSNIGARENNIRQAIQELESFGIQALMLSTIIETEPVGGPKQNFFMNAVLKALTVLSPEEVLKVCLSIEADMGRVRTVVNGPRIIDIDVLLYDQVAINSPSLIIPHPRMWERSFVMNPLKEIAPEICSHENYKIN